MSRIVPRFAFIALMSACCAMSTDSIVAGVVVAVGMFAVFKTEDLKA